MVYEGDSIRHEIVPINQRVLYLYSSQLHFQKDLLLFYTTAKSQLSSSFPTLHNPLLGFYHMLAWWPSWSCDLDHLYKFVSPFTRRLQLKFCFNRPNGLRSLKMVVLDDDGRRLDGYTISPASEPNSSGELKISEFFT